MAAPSSDVVGVVGLGQMGLPIACNLVGAGFRVVGYDIDPGRLALLVESQGDAAGSPRQVTGKADVVVTSLPSAAALDTVLRGPDGLLAAGLDHRDRSLTIIETSTLSLGDKEAARTVAAAAGARLLDCPLSGTGAQARTGDLVVYASGDAAAVERCAPLFEAFARRHLYLGPFGTGTRMKLVANLLVAIHNVAAAEAFVLASKAGLDRQAVYDAITDGAGTSRMFELRGPAMVARSYDTPGATGALFAKDLRIIADLAQVLDCPTPLFTAASSLYGAALTDGLGDLDTAAVCAILERLAGLAP